MELDSIALYLKLSLEEGVAHILGSRRLAWKNGRHGDVESNSPSTCPRANSLSAFPPYSQRMDSTS
jgi:hypothetical protein